MFVPFVYVLYQQFPFPNNIILEDRREGSQGRGLCYIVCLHDSGRTDMVAQRRMDEDPEPSPATNSNSTLHYTTNTVLFQGGRERKGKTGILHSTSPLTCLPHKVTNILKTLYPNCIPQLRKPQTSAKGERKPVEEEIRQMMRDNKIIIKLTCSYACVL